MALQIVRVPAIEGVHWMREGWAIFFRQPLGLGMLFFLCLLVAAIISALPAIGRLALPLTLPFWFVGFMEASRRVGRGEFPWAHTLAAPLKATPGAGLRMLALSALGAAVYLACAWLGSRLDNGVLFELVSTGLVNGKPFNEDAMKLEGFVNALTVMSLLHTLVLAALWYAPALVCWEGYSASKALFASMWALKQNWRAVGLYVLVWNLAFFLLMFVGAKLLALLFGPTALAISLLLPSALILLTAMLSSLYPTYRDVFVNALPMDAAAFGDQHASQ
jgi:hypothetical protein